MRSSFHCSPVIREWSSRKTPTEKIQKKAERWSTNTGRIVDIFVWTWNIWSGSTENTLKQRKMVTKFLSFLKQQISFSSNFTSLFSAMKHNSSVLFSLKFYILLTKWAYQSTNLVKFHVSSQKSEILHFDKLLLSKWYKVSAKKYRRVTSHDTKEWSKLWRNFHPPIQKSENFTSMGSFCPKYI